MKCSVALARKLLQKRGEKVPVSDQEARKAIYEVLIKEDFLAAHSFRLGRNRHEFTKDDWLSILELSGKDKIESNIAALVACSQHGLI